MIEVIYAILEFLSVMLAGFIGGFVGALTGLGGGVVLVPLLTLFYGIPLVFATGASLFSTIVTSAGSASSYVKHKISNVKIGISLALATTTGAIVGALTLIYVEATGLIWIIFVIFGGVLLGSLGPTISKSGKELQDASKPDWSTKFFEMAGKYHDSHLGKEIRYNGIRWWYGIMIVFFAGMLSGLLGIGGGPLNVIAMDGVMTLPMKVTTTTSTFMVGLTAATGSTIYWFQGYIQPFITAATAIGVLIGAYTGARVLFKISSTNIRWIFFWIMGFLGIEMVLKGLYVGYIISISTEIQFAISIVISTVLLMILPRVFRNRGAAT